jgi:hypothetical protein
LTFERSRAPLALRSFPGSLNKVMAYVEPRTKVPLGSISLYLSLGIAFVCCWCVPRNGYRSLPARLPARAILRATLTSC